MDKVLAHIKKTFVTGLFILIPLGITLFILKFLFNFADGILGPYLARIFTAITRHETYIPGMGMVTGAAVIYLAGLLATNVPGTQIIKWWDEVLSKIPLVKSIYTPSKQLTHMFKEGKTSYRRAVFVEWPRRGVRAVGFVTAELERDGEKMIVVYVPTMPNPTSGFALFFHEDEVTDCGMSVEEAIRFIVSSGVVVH